REMEASTLMSKTLRSVFVLLVLLSGLQVLGFAAAAQELVPEKRLVLYASHPTEMIDYFVARFKEKYDVEVDLVYGGTGELLARIRAEADRPQADILWGGGA